MTSEVEQIHSLLSSILENTSGNRKEQEALLKDYSVKFPDQYIAYLLNIITEAASDKVNVKTLATIMMRKSLSGFAPPTSSVNVWPKLLPETREKLKEEIFVVLRNEKNPAVRTQICDTIGEVAASAMCSPDQPIDPITNQRRNDWPNIGAHLYQMYLTKDLTSIEDCLKIFVTLLTYASDFFMDQKAELFAFLKDSIENYTPKIAGEAIQALRSIVTTSEPKECLFFEGILPITLKCLENAFKTDEDLAIDILDAFSDIAESEPKFFKKYFKDLILIISENYNKKYDDEEVREKCVEVIVMICERVPSMLKTNTECIEKLIEMIFIQMINSCEEAEPAWENPPEGFNEKLVEDSEFANVRYCMDQIDRLIGSHETKVILNTLSASVQKLLTSSDWRYVFAALMALSQIGEYVDDLEEVKPVLRVAISNLKSPHSKIRYAACHLLGQISEDLNPKVQANFFTDMLEPILEVAINDPVPRVVCHACAALTNFLEGCSQEQLAPHIETLLKCLLGILQKSSSFVQEGAIASISSLAGAAKESVLKHYKEIMDYLGTLYNAKTDKKCALLKGEIIECITILSQSAGLEAFMPYSEGLITLLVQASKSVGEGYDPLKPYVITGFQRICLVMKKSISPYLAIIVPDLFKIIAKVFEHETKEVDEDAEVQSLIENEMIEKKKKNNVASPEGVKVGEAVKDNVNTSDDASLAIGMLGVFIYKLKGSFLPYVEDCMRLILPLITTNMNENLREESVRCMAGLVRCVKESQVPNKDLVLQNMTRTFMEETWKAILEETDSQIITTQLSSMEDLLKTAEVQWMTNEELNVFCQRFTALVDKSTLRKESFLGDKKQPDLEEEEGFGLDEDIENEEKMQVQALNLFGFFTKIHKEKLMFMYENLVKNMFEPYIKGSDRMKQFALFLIDDVFEYIPPEHIPVVWVDPFFSALEANCTHATPFVRQAAIYGIGLICQNVKTIVPQYFARIWETINKSLDVPQGKSKNVEFRAAKENSISTIGKILKDHGSLLGGQLEAVFLNWVSLLPLTTDHEEAVIAHAFFVDVLVSNPNAVLGANLQNLAKAIEILTESYKTKNSTEELDQKIPLILKNLAAQENVKAVWGSLSLSGKHRTCAENLIKN